MNKLNTYVVIPSLLMLASPFLIAMTGLIDYARAGGLLFYVMIFTAIYATIVHNRIKKAEKKLKQAV